MRKLCILAVIVLVAVAAEPSSKYRITVKVDKQTTFEALRTYAWTACWASFDPALDAHIAAAVDRELAAVGLTKRSEPPSDVVVTFGTVQRTNVDVHGKSEDGSGAYPEYRVGTLVVRLMEPSSRRELFRARVVLPLDTMEPAQLDEEIDAIVAQMFAHYPTRESGSQ